LDSLLTDESWEPIARYASDVRDPPVVAFFGPQRHIATEHYGELDPLSLEEYRKRGGFEMLEHGLRDLSPERVIDEIGRSGLRGRGGAGFPTATKWRKVREAVADTKYIICNGDEGDPGAFMDRMLLESFPYRVIEGMAIAAYTVGANEGYLYVRAEYPFAVRRMTEALSRCEAEGLLGDNVSGSGFRLRLWLFEGAGAFVCGEETALLESIEGQRGIPRMRPPYPAESGLWGKPTLINNVETYALVPWILRNGGHAFSSVGTQTSKGTKVFALAGKVVRGGLIEVPMGITIRQIVDEIGGGIQGGKQLKAVLIGGPSGGCVPADLADTPVDYESLTALGAIMGSGGLVVLDESDCMVAIARYFLSFCQYESCGKCTFCSIGTRRMLDILDRLCAGQAKKSDLQELETLAAMVRKGSLCGLGRTAPNPVVSSLRHFRAEYEAHVEGRCPAGRCKALITYSVGDKCVGCTLCAQHCPADAIPMTPFQRHAIDSQKCTRCDTCRQVCPENAIEVR
jgi:NADH-quinone oxidoreductase subunit F